FDFTTVLIFAIGFQYDSTMSQLQTPFERNLYRVFMALICASLGILSAALSSASPQVGTHSHLSEPRLRTLTFNSCRARQEPESTPVPHGHSHDTPCVGSGFNFHTLGAGGNGAARVSGGDTGASFLYLASYLEVSPPQIFSL